MVDQCYTRSISDYCVYINKFHSDAFIIMLIYVDNMLIVEWGKSKIEKLKKKLSKSFDMKDLRLARQILGKISRDRNTRRLLVSWEGYIQKEKIQYAWGQASWFSSRESFQIEFTIVPLNWKGAGDEGSFICFSYRKFDVCHDMYDAWYCTCSWCCE